MKMRSLLLAGCLTLSSVTFAAEPAPGAAIAPAKEAQIRKLLQLTKTNEVGQQLIEQMAAQLKPAFPKAPEQFWTEFFKEVKPNELMDKLVPIYAKHFTDAELADIIKFYQSPSGQKLITSQPMIVQESQLIGQTWGREIGERVFKRLQDKGYVDASKK